MAASVLLVLLAGFAGGAGRSAPLAAAQIQAADPETLLRAMSLSLADLPGGFTEDAEAYQYFATPQRSYALSRTFRADPDTSDHGVVRVLNTLTLFADDLTAEQAVRNPRGVLGFGPDWRETAAPAVAASSRAFRLDAPPALFLIARQSNLLLTLLIEAESAPPPLEALRPYVALVEGRVQQAFATTCAASAVDTPTLASAGPPDVPGSFPGEVRSALAALDPRVRAALLTPAEAPAGLPLNQRASGPMTLPGMRGYIVSYGDDRLLEPSMAAFAGAPPGTLLAAVSVALLPAQPADPAVLDSMLRRGLDFASGQAAPDGSAERLPEVYMSSAVGEDSRAGAIRGHQGDFTYSEVLLYFYRNGVYAGVELIAAGDTPLVDQTLSLAHQVDARLRATAPGAGAAPPGAELASAPLQCAPGLPAADESRLLAALLQETDVSEQARLSRSATGPFTMLETPGYMLFFLNDVGLGAESSLFLQPEGTLLAATELALVRSEVPEPGLLDRMVEGSQRFFSTTFSLPLTSISPPTALPPPAVGDDRRAFSVNTRQAGVTTTMAFIAFQRERVVVLVGEVFIGQDAPPDRLVRLAELVDQRLIERIAQ
jgi:hypothetical protein